MLIDNDSHSGYYVGIDWKQSGGDYAKKRN